MVTGLRYELNDTATTLIYAKKQIVPVLSGFGKVLPGTACIYGFALEMVLIVTFLGWTYNGSRFY